MLYGRVSSAKKNAEDETKKKVENKGVAFCGVEHGDQPMG